MIFQAPDKFTSCLKLESSAIAMPSLILWAYIPQDETKKNYLPHIQEEATFYDINMEIQYFSASLIKILHYFYSQ
jgi:hypothetical protein